MRRGGFEAGLVAGAVLACVVWMAVYWPDAAARDAAIERCEAALDGKEWPRARPALLPLASDQ